MREVAEEAHELIDEDVITEEDFRDFVFANPARLWTESIPSSSRGNGGRGSGREIARCFGKARTAHGCSVAK
jgi:hypothetical protein